VSDLAVGMSAAAAGAPGSSPLLAARFVGVPPLRTPRACKRSRSSSSLSSTSSSTSSSSSSATSGGERCLDVRSSSSSSAATSWTVDLTSGLVSHGVRRSGRAEAMRREAEEERRQRHLKKAAQAAAARQQRHSGGTGTGTAADQAVAGFFGHVHGLRGRVCSERRSSSRNVKRRVVFAVSPASQVKEGLGQGCQEKAAEEFPRQCDDDEDRVHAMESGGGQGVEYDLPTPPGESTSEEGGLWSLEGGRSLAGAAARRQLLVKGQQGDLSSFLGMAA